MNAKRVLKNNSIKNEHMIADIWSMVLLRGDINPMTKTREPTAAIKAQKREYALFK